MKTRRITWLATAVLALLAIDVRAEECYIQAGICRSDGYPYDFCGTGSDCEAAKLAAYAAINNAGADVDDSEGECESYTCDTDPCPDDNPVCPSIGYMQDGSGYKRVYLPTGKWRVVVFCKYWDGCCWKKQPGAATADTFCEALNRAKRTACRLARQNRCAGRISCTYQILERGCCTQRCVQCR